MSLRLTLVLSLLSAGSCRATSGAHPQAVNQSNQGARYLETGQPARAKEAYLLCLEYTPDFDRCLNGLGLAALQAGLQEEAASWFRKAIKANRDFAEARTNLGAYYEEKRQPERAIELYNSSLGIDPGYQPARYNLARVQLGKARRLAAKGQLENVKTLLSDAESQLMRLAQLAPLRSDGFSMLAAVYMERAQHFAGNRSQDMERARVTFGQCLSANPSDLDCLAIGAFLAHAMGDCDLANQRIATMQSMGRGLERVPGLQQRVQACLAARDSGIRNLEATWQSEANRGNLRPLFDLCAHYVARKVVDRANATCQMAMKRAPKAAGLRRVYAEFLIELQQPEEAISVCEEVLRLAAKDEPAAVEYCREALRMLRLGGP
jgi:tetratricopeptide (TPR) repeat protein